MHVCLRLCVSQGVSPSLFVFVRVCVCFFVRVLMLAFGLKIAR